MEKPFRAAYAPAMEATTDRLKVHVIGHRMRLQHVVNVPAGTPCTFMHVFHDPVPVRTRQGMKDLPRHTLIAFAPHTPLFHGRSDRPWHQSWIRVSGTLVAPLLARHGIESHVPLYFEESQPNVEWLLAMHREMHHPKGVDMENVEALFCVWLRHIQRAQGAKPRVPERFLRARQYIETHFLEPLTLEAIAKHAFVSRSHLCKGYRQHFGQAPLAYAIHLRLQHAAQLLKNIDLSITEVAAESGFRDVYYFSRIFKKHMGMTPTTYRRGG